MSADRALGADVLFSHRHEDATPAIHLEIVDAWASPAEFVLIEGFRGSAKTTKGQEFLTMEALFENFHFQLLFGETWAKACEKLENIRFELRTNHKILALFGNTLGKSSKSVSRDAVDQLILNSGVRIDAYGKGQSPRGRLYHGHRPERAMLDDIENKLNGDVASKEAVDATMQWLYAEVIPALDPKRRRVRVNATPEGVDCMPVRLRTDPAWVKRSYPILIGEPEDDNAIPLWPERFPLIWVREQKKLFEGQNLGEDFDREYLVRAITDELRDFDRRDLREADALPSQWLPRYVMYDPARTSDANRSNRTGRVVAAYLGATIYVIESLGALWKPSEMIEDMFVMQDRYNPIGLGVESDSLEDYIREPLRAAMIAKSTVLPLVDLRAPSDKSKHDFIRGALQPFSRAQAIVLVGGAKAHPQLVKELEKFPSKNDDVINALAYLLKMRPGEPKYADFSDSNVSTNAQPQRGQTIYLAFNQSKTEVTCVAVQLVGLALYVLREWAEPGPAADAVRSIWMSAQGELGRFRLIAYAPADVFDDWTHLTLIKDLRAINVPVTRGGYYHESEGNLADSMRTVIRGQRGLLVAPTCERTINGLFGGYCVAMKGTRLADEPVDNVYRTLVRGMEGLVHALARGQGAAYQSNTVMVEGRSVHTTRPDLYARRR